MIIKGKSRAGASALGNYLASTEVNERALHVETKGTVAQDLRGALLEMAAYAAGTRCEKPLYHAIISPQPPHRLTDAQRTEAVDVLEDKLGLKGHARIVVVHEKLGREHIHVVWSRINLEKMCAVSDSHNYRKHEEASRELERRFGHDRIQGAHAEREGVERPHRSPSRSELRQEERTGIKGKDVRDEVTAAFRASDNAHAFKAALEDGGYLLANGDRRDFVIVDRAGGTHSLARRIDGINAAELREFMKPLDRESLPDAERAKEVQLDRANGIPSAHDIEKWEDALAASGIEKAKEIEEELKRRAYEALAKALREKAYGCGDGYVNQSKAALKDYEHRQDELDEFNEEPRPIHPDEFSQSTLDIGADGDGFDDRDEDQQRIDKIIEDNRKKPGDDIDRPSSKADSGKFDNVEMSDRLSRLIDRYAEATNEIEGTDHEHDAGPDRQREAPGGGRTRSR